MSYGCIFEFRAWGDQVSDCLMSKRSSVGDDHHQHNHHIGISSTIKMKKMKGRRKVREPRFCFKTMSDVDVLDDGYKWRKYGQKVVKNTQHPRYIYMYSFSLCLALCSLSIPIVLSPSHYCLFFYIKKIVFCILVLVYGYGSHF
jgi:hypothetical protein